MSRTLPNFDQLSPLKFFGLALLIISLVLSVSGFTLFENTEAKAIKYNQLIEACQKGNEAKAKLLLSEGVEPNGNDFRDKGLATSTEYFAALKDPPIAVAAEKGDYRLVKLLLAYDAEPDLCCCSCVTALHLAIKKKYEKVVELLLKNGADPMEGYDGTMTTIELARRDGNKGIVAKLISHSEEPRTAEQVTIRLYLNPKYELDNDKEKLLNLFGRRGKENIRLARNVIFARHNYMFKDAKLTNYYKRLFPSYEPETEEVELSKIDKNNIEVLRSLN